MYVKINSNQSATLKKVFSLNMFSHRIRVAAITAISILLLFFAIVLSIFYGMVLHKRGHAASLNAIAEMIVKSRPLTIVPNYLKGLVSTTELLIIDIKHINYQKLAYKREQAFSDQHLSTGTDDYVPAVIRHKDREYKVDLRLKGDNTDHLHGDKWSFRVKLKADNALFGMNKFSIQKPFTRRYVNEWIYHQALKREGLLSLRYKFVRVILNGKNLGVYALEEHFDKYLIEHNNRREGPIVKFNEDLFWIDAISGSGTYLASNVSGFKMNKVLSDPVLFSQYTKASELLESFRRGELRTSEVFEVRKMAMHFALSTLLGGSHSFLWHNVRFYYNPMTSRLESIGFDADAGMSVSSLFGHSENIYVGRYRKPYTNFRGMIFSDEVFFREYVRALEKVSVKAYLDGLFKDIKDELNENLNILYSSYPLYHFSDDVFYRNQGTIRRALNPQKGIHAFFKEVLGNKVTLSLGSVQCMPVEILGLSYKDNVLCKLTESITLPSKHGLVEYEDVEFPVKLELDQSDLRIEELKVNYRLLGASTIRSENVFPWPNPLDVQVGDDILRQRPNPDTFEFIYTDEINKRILIKPGKWKIDKPLIISSGYRVVCGETTELRLTNSASILSWSPLEFIGSEDNPISIYSVDTTGQGVVVLNANETSVLDYVNFTNLSNPSRHGWDLTGAVTFYESPVKISHCRFLRNRSEDGLNIMRSDFEINNTLFGETPSDAFDGDFCKGTITGSSFVNLGNDAIDVSGTELELENIFIDHAGDKGISIGENSRATVSQITIKNSEIAVTSKDMSEITIDNIEIEECRVGFTLYQKKCEFGPASISSKNVKMGQVELYYLVEYGSNLVVDGEQILPNKENVKEILYGEEYGKSSK